jgi:cobalt/nickel transport system permease protein
MQTLRGNTSFRHWLARVDPRVKLLAVAALLPMVLSGRGESLPLVVGAVSVAGALSLGVRPKALAVRFSQPLLIALAVLLLKLFLPGSEPLFSLKLFGFELAGYRDGLVEGCRIASRIGGAVSLVALLGFSTSFTELMAALAWLRVPPAFTEVALFAWRYLFLLYDDAQVVYAAQKNRLGYVGYRRGLSSLGTLAGTLMIKAFDSSQTITTAMVQRGYDGTMPVMRHQPFRLRELAGATLVVAAAGALCLVQQDLFPRP